MRIQWCRQQGKPGQLSVCRANFRIELCGRNMVALKIGKSLLFIIVVLSILSLGLIQTGAAYTLGSTSGIWTAVTEAERLGFTGVWALARLHGVLLLRQMDQVDPLFLGWVLPQLQSQTALAMYSR